MTEVHVTDHAVLRYLERACGVDIEAVRAEIARAVRRGVATGACGVRRDGLNFRLAGATVVTVAPVHSHDRRIGRRPRAGQDRALEGDQE